MATFSRWMPAAPRQRASARFWIGFAVGAALLVSGLVWALIHEPAARFIAGFVVVLGVFATVSERRRLQRLAADRVGEDIGTFARAFNRRETPFDPWVVRATWDALQPYMKFRGGRAPLRPSDGLFTDLDLDGDAVDFEIIPEIAARCSRSVDRCETNPMYGRVATVGDLVQFITVQPRRDAA